MLLQDEGERMSRDKEVKKIQKRIERATEELEKAQSALDSLGMSDEYIKVPDSLQFYGFPFGMKLGFALKLNNESNILTYDFEESTYIIGTNVEYLCKRRTKISTTPTKPEPGKWYFKTNSSNNIHEVFHHEQVYYELCVQNEKCLVCDSNDLVPSIYPISAKCSYYEVSIDED